jgi:hypothetical protein
MPPSPFPPRRPSHPWPSPLGERVSANKNGGRAFARRPVARRRLWAAGRRVMDAQGAHPATACLPHDSRRQGGGPPPRLREARRRVRGPLRAEGEGEHDEATPVIQPAGRSCIKALGGCGKTLPCCRSDPDPERREGEGEESRPEYSQGNARFLALRPACANASEGRPKVFSLPAV